MAAPSAGTAFTSVLTGTPYTINVGSPSAGTLLIVLVRFSALPGTITFTGYTSLNGAAGNATDASDDTTIIFYRWADGTEGASDTLTTVTGSIKGAAICWPVSGADNPAVSVPQISAVAIGTTTANTANPNSVAPAGAPQDTLYLAVMGLDGELNEPTASPASYSTIVNENSGTGGAVATNCAIGGGFRQINASSSEDPGAFTHPSANAGWTAYALAIRPPQPAVQVFHDPLRATQAVNRSSVY